MMRKYSVNRSNFYDEHVSQDVSQVTNMHAMFQRAISLPISHWNLKVTSVNNMNYMFVSTLVFNQQNDNVKSFLFQNVMFR